MFRERWLRPSPVTPVLANSDIEDLGQAFPIVWSPHPLPWPRFEGAEADGHGMCPPQAHTRDTLPPPPLPKRQAQPQTQEGLPALELEQEKLVLGVGTGSWGGAGGLPGGTGPVTACLTGFSSLPGKHLRCAVPQFWHPWAHSHPTGTREPRLWVSALPSSPLGPSRPRKVHSGSAQAHHSCHALQ